ncbi:MAG: hypothetical protein JKY48_06470 [Flavobacteriales bacterium]|nr:hypothetical protein [Flavobacteriales bacterium]
MKQFLTTLFFCFLSLTSFSQNSYDQLVGEGLELLKQQKITLALDKYKQAYQLDSTKVEANYGLGSGYLYLCKQFGTQCDDALYYLTKSIKLDDTYRNSYYNRGVLKTLQQDFKGAISDLTKAIKRTPNKSKYYIIRAFAYENLNDRTNECLDLYNAMKLGSESAKKKLANQYCG